MSPAHLVQVLVLGVMLAGCVTVLGLAGYQAARDWARRTLGTPQEREALAARWNARDARLRQASRSGGHCNRKRTHP